MVSWCWSTWSNTFIYIYTFRGAGFLRGANDSNQPEKEHPKPDDEVPMPGDGDNRERESGRRESEPAGSSSSALLGSSSALSAVQLLGRRHGRVASTLGCWLLRPLSGTAL